MSHRKVYSQGNIPFAWEDSPGVSKAIHQDKVLHALNLSSSSSSSPSSASSISRSDTSSGRIFSAHEDIKIPLPPCQNSQPPRRNTSAKGFGWWQEDPFLAAYKECTKNIRNGKLVSENKKNSNVIGYNKVRKNSVFSCKDSCDVKDGSLVRLSNLPPIPKARVRGR